MKVIHVITTLDIGGAEMMLYNLVSEQKKSGYSIKIVSLSKNGKLVEKIKKLEIPVIELGLSPSFPNPLKLLTLIRLIRRDKPDVLQTWMYHSNLIGSLAARLAGNVPTIWGIHHTKLDPATDKRTTLWIAKLCARMSRTWPKKIVYCSEASQKEHEAFGYDKEKSAVVPNGFDVERFRPNPEAKFNIRKELGLPDEAILIGSVGRFHPDKDYRTFVRAAKMLAQTSPKAHFLLCGLNLNPENAELAGWIKDAGLETKFFLLGSRDDIPAVMNALDIFTLSSKTEASPLVIGEAMASGLPCAATGVGDLPDIISGTGRTVQPKNPEALAAAWQELIEMDKESRESLGRLARERIAHNFSLSKTVKSYEKIYENLKSKQPPSRTLAFFFTRGVSLKIWDKVGNLSRDIKTYNELSKHFDKIWFFTYGDESDMEYKRLLADNISIIPKRWNVPDAVYMLLLPLAGRKEIRQASVLKTNQMKGGLAAYLSKLIYKKPLVVRCGYEWLEFSEKFKASSARLWLIRNIERIMYKGADHVILTAENLKTFVLNRFQTPETKITIVPNYIDTELFRPMDVVKETKSICFVGRLIEQKNLFNLIAGLSELDLRLIIFGSGELEELLRAHAKEKNVEVEFRGNIPNEQLPGELNKAGMFVLPSLYEGNPKVLLEAMASGLPVIATDVVGIREIVKHKQNGFLCAAEAASIHDAIAEVMNDSELRSKIAKGARETILTDFALPVVLRKELGIYENL